MRRPMQNAVTSKLPIIAVGAVLVCAFAMALAVGPAAAAAQEPGEGEAGSEKHASLVAGEAVSPERALAAGEAGAGELDAGGLGVQAQGEPIASGENGTCVWEIDANGKLTIEPADGVSGTMGFYNPLTLEGSSNSDWRPDWYPFASKITSAEVRGTVRIVGPGGGLFEDCRNLAEVDLSGLDTSGLLNFSSMFYNCSKLTSVDISMLDASRVGDLHYMFWGCANLVDVKLPDFSKAKIRFIFEMFAYCRSLKMVDLSTITNTAYIEGSRHLFCRCTSLEKVVVSKGWSLHSKPSDVSFEKMFEECNALVGQNGTAYASCKIDDVSYARVDAADAPGYFWLAESEGGSASSGEGSDTSGGGEGDVGDIQQDDGGEPSTSGEMGTCVWEIDNNGKLTIEPIDGVSGTLNFVNLLELDLYSEGDWHPGWYRCADRVVSAEVKGTVYLEGRSSRLFEGCKNLVEVDLSGLDTSRMRTFHSMFKDCQKLASVDVSMFDTSLVESVTCMFSGCKSLANVDLSAFDLSRVSSFGNMFDECSNLASIDMSMLDAPAAKRLFAMFRDCTRLREVKLPDFSNAKVENIACTFDSCESLDAVDLSTIDTSNVTSAFSLFWVCKSLQRVTVGDKWDLPGQVDASSSSSFGNMFSACNSLVGQNGTAFAQCRVDDPSYARVDAAGAPGYFWLAGSEQGGGNQGQEGQGGGQGDGGQQGDGDGQGGGSTGGEGAGGQGDGGPGSGGGGGEGASGKGDGPGSGESSGNGEGEGAGAGDADGTGEGGAGAGNAVQGAGSGASPAPSAGKPASAASKVAAGKSGSAVAKPAAGGSSSAASGKPASAAAKASSSAAAAKEAKRASIARAAVRLSAKSFAYNGKAQRPSVTVKLGKKALKRGRDYTVSYSKGCKKPGTYKVVVTGKGAYRSKVTKAFAIAAKPERTSIAKAAVRLSASAFAYDGKAKKPGVTVKLGKRALKRGRDFSVSYAKGRRQVGSYKVTVTGKGAYKSSVRKRFAVVPSAPELRSLKAHKNSNGSSGFVVSWKKAKPASVGYEVSWSPSPSFGKAGSFSFAGGADYARQGAVALRVRTAAWLGRTVYVKMRAVQAVGGKAYRSAWSAPKRVKLKK